MDEPTDTPKQLEPRNSIWSQIRRNAVALISLVVALAGLGYNTWRNETTEAQRNTRYAAFRMVEELGALQQVVNVATYGGQLDSDWYFVGWGKVNLIEDLALVMPPDDRPDTESLYARWFESSKAMRNWNSEDRELRDAARDAEKQMQAVIEDLRTDIRESLQMLE